MKTIRRSFLVAALAGFASALVGDARVKFFHPYTTTLVEISSLVGRPSAASTCQRFVMGDVAIGADVYKAVHDRMLD